MSYAKIEEKGSVEISMSVPMPGASPNQPQKMHSEMVLADFGQGAESAITEEPMQMPAAAIPGQ